MRVLAYTPTYRLPNGELALRAETRAAVEAQVFDGELVWEVGLENPWPYPTHKNVLAQYQHARLLALAGGYDALWTVEHDMVPPADALQKMSYTPAGVVYGVYLLRHGSWVLNAWEYIGPEGLGESLSLYPAKVAKAREVGSVRVCGCGWGCTLIHRPVLEQVEFTDGGGENPAGDLAFAWSCLRAGIPAVARFDVACDHLDGELRLRPFGGAVSDMVTVRALQNVVVFDGGSTVKMEIGKVYELRRGTLQDLIRAGYVEVVEDQESAPEAAVVEPEETAVARKPKKRVAKGQGGLR
jgi:hypothetical protein